MDNIQLASRLSAMEATLEAVRERLRELTLKAEALERQCTINKLELNGAMEELSGSSISLEEVIALANRLHEDLRLLSQANDANWREHHLKCQHCAASLLQACKEMLEQTRVSLQKEMDQRANMVENMGVVALIRRFWWQTLLIVIVITLILKLDYQTAGHIMRFMLAR